jgi:hypothetical protein
MATNAVPSIAKRSVPYLPFKTFLNSLDTFAQGIPPKLDRTVWKSQAGLVQGLIMNTYRFLGLVDDNDAPEPYLESMVKTPEKRPEELRFLIEAQYSDIIEAHDLTKMTQKMLEDEFEKYFSVTGTTKQKAITFFLKAAKFADMPLSPFLMHQIRNTAPRKKRAANRNRGPQETQEEQNGGGVFILEDPNASTHVVRLSSGGQMTLAITANPFKMSATDREFVFSLIDKLQEYEKANGTSDSEEEE